MKEQRSCNNYECQNQAGSFYDGIGAQGAGRLAGVGSWAGDPGQLASVKQDGTGDLNSAACLGESMVRELEGLLDTIIGQPGSELERETPNPCCLAEAIDATPQRIREAAARHGQVVEKIRQALKL